MRTHNLMVASAMLVPLCAWAGRGGSTGKIQNAINSGSPEAIVGAVERAEKLACLSCVAPILKLVDHESAKVRDVAGWWLGKRGVRGEVITSMTARFSGQDPVAARNAADVLAAMRDYTTLPQLTAYLSHPLDEASGVSTAKAIAAIGHPSSAPALQAAFQSALPQVRAAAVQAMRDLRAPQGQRAAVSAAQVVPMFADADASVRRQAAMTAGYIQDAASVSELTRLVTSDASAQVRKAAAWALGQIGGISGAPGSGAADALAQAASSDTDPLVRSVAHGALGRLK